MNNWKKVFTIIWTGQLFSTLSSAVVGYAVVFWLSIKTGSAEVLALATIATLLPQLLLGLFSGVLIDRWDRRQTMIYSDGFIAVCSAVMGIMFYFGKVETEYFYILLVLRSIGSAFHIPAMQASVPLLAPEDQLMRVAGVNQVIQSISTIAGPAIAAILITALDMTYVMMFDVIGAVIAIISLLMVAIPNPEKSDSRQTPNMLLEMKEGLHVIYSNRGLYWLYVFFILCSFFTMPVGALFPLMTLDHFSGNTYQMSLVEVVWGIGTLLGGAALGLPKMTMNKIFLINAMYLLFGFTIGLSGILPPSGFITFLILTFICGISGAIFHSSFMVVIQTTVDPAVLGRVFAMFGSITLMPSMIGLLATGFIADSIGVANSFIICGSAFFLIGIASFLNNSLKQLAKDMKKGAVQN